MEKVSLQQTWKFYIQLSGKQDSSDEGLKASSSNQTPSPSPTDH